MKLTPSRASGSFMFLAFLLSFAVPVGAVNGGSPTDLGTAYLQAQIFVSGARTLRVQRGAYEKATKAPGLIAQVSTAKELSGSLLDKLVKTAWNKNPALNKPIGYADSISAYLAKRLGFSCGSKDPCLVDHEITGRDGPNYYTFAAIEGYSDVIFATGNILSEQHPAVSKIESAVTYRMSPKGELVTFSVRKVSKSPQKAPVTKDYLPNQLTADERQHYISQFANTKASWATFADSIPPHEATVSESLK